jgi:hypothetical protein
MKVSESARMTTAAQARFRIDAPNSLPRDVMVIALDRPSEPVIKHLAAQQWNRARFFTASAFAAMPHDQGAQHTGFSMQGWLSDLAGRTNDLIEIVSAADLVVMVASAGEDAQAAAIIGEACQARHVMTTALVLGAPDASATATLAQLRPHANMLVAATTEDYIADMLTALRA